jgi:hypothetical protein
LERSEPLGLRLTADVDGAGASARRPAGGGAVAAGALQAEGGGVPVHVVVQRGLVTLCLFKLFLVRCATMDKIQRTTESINAQEKINETNYSP